MARVFLTLLLIFFSTRLPAFEIEGITGVNVTTYDEASDANSYGLSVVAKMNFYGSSNDSGVFSSFYCPANHVLLCNVTVGYGWKSSGTWFFEGGLGGAYHAGFGAGGVGFISPGVRFSANAYLSFPIILQLGGMQSLMWLPFFGYTF